MKPNFFILFISVFYAIGLGLLAYAGWAARRSSVAATWPTARGSVRSCSIETSSDSEGGTTYQVKVSYHYFIGDKQYAGDRIAYGYASGARNAAEQIYAKLRSAKSIEVRYDPRDPTVSTLSFGLHRTIRFLLAFAVTWLAFVVGFTVIWWVASQNDDVLLKNLIAR